MNAKFAVLTSLQSGDWERALPASQSVFGSVAFARITERHSGHSARLLVCDTEYCKVVYPFLMRSLKELPFANSTVLDPSTYYDTITPEYTGPLAICGPSQESEAFDRAWLETRGSLGIIAEFAHLHPWNSLTACLDPAGVSFDRDIVYVDLTVGLATMREESFTYACRKNLRRAESAGIEVRPAADRQDIAEFYRVYTSTMERNNARASYYFPLEYFLSFFEEMPANACFMMALREGKVIAGTLYLHDDTDVYSYLGGADQEYQQMRPSNAVVYETIKWAKTLCRKRLILGGGYRPDDGIFRFKASFSPLRARFSVYRKVHLPVVYESLACAWSESTGADPAQTSYFPVYRAQGVSESFAAAQDA